MSPYQFLKQLSMIPAPAGEGFRVERNISPTSVAVTTATRSVVNSKDVIIFDAVDESVVLNVGVPEDYDETADELTVSVFAQYVSGTSVEIDLDVTTRNRPGASSGVIFPPDPPSFVVAGFADNGWKEFDLSGMDHLVGDVLSVEIDAAAVTGLGVVHLLGLRIKYKSSLVFSDPDSR